jgi:hypothetical protein
VTEYLDEGDMKQTMKTAIAIIIPNEILAGHLRVRMWYIFFTVVRYYIFHNKVKLENTSEI